MHAAARFLINGFGQEGGGFAFLCRQVFDNVLDDHGIVRHVGHVGKLNLNLHLAGSAYLVVVVLYADAPVLHHHAHTAAQIVSHVLGGRDMVAALVGDFIAVVARCVQAVIPVRLPGVDAVAALLGSDLKAGAVKEVEFEFRPYDHSVRYPGVFHIIYRT